MSKIILVRGLPGTGKSTFTKKNSGALHLEADMFYIRGGEYCFDAPKISSAHRWCQDMAKIAVNNGMDIVVSNTFTTSKEMQFYIDLASEYNVADFVVYRMTQNFGSIHNVPDDVIEKMKNRFEDYEGEILV